MPGPDVHHPGIGLIVLPQERWTTRRQARQQFVARLSRCFPTVWMNPPHQRTGIGARWRSGTPEWSRAESAPELDVFTPPAWLPRLHRPAGAAALADRLRLGRARDRLLRAGARRIVLSIWHPEHVGALARVRHDAVLYHVNDEYSYSPEELPTSGEERTLLGRADATYFSSRTLLEAKGPLARRAVFLPNGADCAAFAAPAPEPDDLAPVPHPRIGYTGWVKPQLDWELIGALARARPDLHLVFVGEISRQPGMSGRLDALRSLPNVHFLGGKSSAELAAYPQHFDVCAMPYLVDGYTRYIYPLKLHEYLAGGRPTLGTPLPALAEFEGVVAVAAGVGEWSAAVDRLLAPAAGSDAAREARQAVARAHEWDALASRLERDIVGLFPAR